MDDLLRVALEETSFLSPKNDNTEEILARVKSIIPLAVQTDRRARG